MSTLVELGAAVLNQAEKRVEVAGENIANVATPAYKRRVSFSTLLESSQRADAAVPQVNTTIDFASGKMQATGNPSDFAIAGPGYFLLRSDDRQIYSRRGQLTIDAQGRLVNAQGFALQLESGSDLVVGSGGFEILSDRTVVQKNVSLGRIAVFEAPEEGALEPVDGGFRSSAELAPSSDAIVRQGMIEGSNVSTGNEMVVMMEALRRAESGQRVINVYDDLMGRAITLFGESAR